MLSKLIKHEFKATARLLLPLYLIALVLGLLERFVISLNIFKGFLGIIPDFISFAYVVSMIAVVVVTFVIMITRFYKNLMTDEGYLMFTLPVKPSSLINAKLLVSVVWNIVSFLVVAASLTLVFITPSRINYVIDGIRTGMHEFLQIYNGNIALLIFEIILLMIIGLFSNILLIYVSIAVGQLFNGHKIIGSFVAYIGISTILQIVTTIIMTIIGYIFSRSVTEMNSIPQMIFPICIIIVVVSNVVFYWATDFIFRKKLNLE